MTPPQVRFLPSLRSAPLPNIWEKSKLVYLEKLIQGYVMMCNKLKVLLSRILLVF